MPKLPDRLPAVPDRFLTLTVSGSPGSGKSTLLYFLKIFLPFIGISVEYGPDSVTDGETDPLPKPIRQRISTLVQFFGHGPPLPPKDFVNLKVTLIERTLRTPVKKEK